MVVVEDLTEGGQQAHGRGIEALAEADAQAAGRTMDAAGGQVLGEGQAVLES
jgi:hypothetical protein